MNGEGYYILEDFLRDSPNSITKEENGCDKIFEEFGLEKEKSHIICGHVPVKIKKPNVDKFKLMFSNQCLSILSYLEII